MTDTLRLTSSASDLGTAAALIRQGRCVAFPTETVYGLGANARDGDAVAGIYAAKNRPEFNPLIVHVPDVGAAQKLIVWSDAADQLAQAFWPGPLTLVGRLRAGHGISPLVTAGLETLAVRVPGSAVARDLLEAAEVPVAAPSANPSGRISPTTAAHVLAGLDGRIAAVVDGGPCAVGLESTILHLGPPVQLLRAGGVTGADIERTLGMRAAAPVAGGITAPGQLASHYAPLASVRLNAAAPRDGEVYVGFGPGAADLSLSPQGDLSEAAA